jgi:RHS repeat-associated protein
MKKFVSLSLIVTLLSQTLLVPVSAKSPDTDQTQPKIANALSADYHYDASGNLTNDGVRQIDYDAPGMPSKIELTGKGIEASFIYDGSGSRIAKIVKTNGQLTSTTVYFGNMEKETDYTQSPAKQTTTKYYFAGGKRIALRKNNGDPIYLHKDHLSSSTLFTNSSGAKQDTLVTYHPYGNRRDNWDMPVPSVTPPITNHLYTDQIQDPETELYYYNARYYSPQIGLFISPDTIGKDLNKYAYANNNPVVFLDPKGTDGFYFAQQQFIKIWLASGAAHPQPPPTYIEAANPPSPTYIGAANPPSPTYISARPSDPGFIGPQQSSLEALKQPGNWPEVMGGAVNSTIKENAYFFLYNYGESATALGELITWGSGGHIRHANFNNVVGAGNPEYAEYVATSREANRRGELNMPIALSVLALAMSAKTGGLKNTGKEMTIVKKSGEVAKINLSSAQQKTLDIAFRAQSPCPLHWADLGLIKPSEVRLYDERLRRIAIKAGVYWDENGNLNSGWPSMLYTSVKRGMSFSW